MEHRVVNALVIDAVIPARGGSKRLPGKNLASLGGQTLLAHSIRFALEHPLVRDVYVSTDSAEIAAESRLVGAAVIDRPLALATDHAKTSDVIRHALQMISRTPTPDLIATLQPTSPLRIPQWLDDCVTVLNDVRFDSAVTVSPAESKVGRITDGKFEPRYQLESRSQDVEPLFRENGIIYLTRSECIGAGTVFGKSIGAVVIDHPFATVDIDVQKDLDHAAVVMEAHI